MHRQIFTSGHGALFLASRYLPHPPQIPSSAVAGNCWRVHRRLVGDRGPRYALPGVTALPARRP
jgi:hypothetical protein